MKNIIIPASAAGRRLSDWLKENGYGISADCGGRGTCGKCKVNVICGEFVIYSPVLTGGTLPYKPDGQGQILACRAVCPLGGAEISLPENEGSGLISHDPRISADGGRSGSVRGFGAALDIGTTTLAASLVNRATGEVIDTYSCLNPQRSYGADVISRIMACRNGHLDELCRLIRLKTVEILNNFISCHPDMRPEILTVAGNTTMLHLFCGVSPDGIGVYPFTPAFTGQKNFTGDELCLPVRQVIVLPSAAAYIGSDITGGVLACGMLEIEGPSVLMDIGTNGEMVLSTGRARGARLIAASTAAGPALEGANISCGVGGIPGAVSHVSATETGFPRMTYRTIGNKAPVGICGCGLIDLVSALLDRGVIDETGYMEDGGFPLCCTPEAAARHISEDGREFLPSGTVPVVLTQKDVREFQLAKSALYAGFISLLNHAGLSVGDLERIYIAGGLGYYMSVKGAVRTGILPPVDPEKISIAGNTSLAGAEAVLTDPGVADRISDIAMKCEVLDLNTLTMFSELFMQNMMFPEK